jgi:hypothetical protein
MTKSAFSMGRRSFMTAAAGFSAGLAAPAVWAQSSYPSRNFNVTIPTGEGGGAALLSRIFTNSWRKDLGREFEFEFYPGAAGQVGYEHYINRRDHDGHNLLFGNVSAEMIMYALQGPNFSFPEDLYYFASVDTDPCGIWVIEGSPFETVEQVIEEAMTRPVSFAVSRMPHPGTIGLLALAEATGANFNIVPYGGGNPQTVAVINGEVDCGGGGTGGYVEGRKVLGIFDNKEYVLRETHGDAPLINDVFGTSIPDLYSSRSWAVHRDWADSNPEHYELLKSTAAAVFEDPQFKEEIISSGASPWEGIRFRDQAETMAFAENTIDLAKRYEAQLTA